MSNSDRNSSLQNIALTSGTNRDKAINFNSDSRFSGHTPANCFDHKDKLLPHHDVTDGRVKEMDGGAVVCTAQLPVNCFCPIVSF